MTEASHASLPFAPRLTLQGDAQEAAGRAEAKGKDVARDAEQGLRGTADRIRP